MTKGMEIRATIDTETVKGLFLLNGGGSVALLALLPIVLGKENLEPLARAALWGLFFHQCGLAAALIHNRLRNLCSKNYEQHNYAPPPGQLFGRQLKQPKVCALSIVFMWSSLALSMLAAIRVLAGGFASI